ncbi:MAG: MBL fold metallo-hydrolase [Candidatus Limnocylindrales bacterium]
MTRVVQERVTVKLTWLGHSTVVVELPGLTILTDPFLGDRLGPLRRHGSVPDPELLPDVDLVFISHAHPDHFDPASIRALRGSPRLLVPAGMARAVSRIVPAGRVEGMRVGQVHASGPWRTTAVPAKHWRWPRIPGADTIGYLVEGPVNVYFAGDTGTFPEMGDLTGRVDIALLPISRWGPQPTPGHLTPGSAARVAALIGASTVLPIHWGTLYPRGLERVLPAPFREPGARFRSAMTAASPAVHIVDLRPGGSESLALRPR